MDEPGVLVTAAPEEGLDDKEWLLALLPTPPEAVKGLGVENAAREEKPGVIFVPYALTSGELDASLNDDPIPPAPAPVPALPPPPPPPPTVAVAVDVVVVTVGAKEPAEEKLGELRPTDINVEEEELEEEVEPRCAEFGGAKEGSADNSTLPADVEENVEENVEGVEGVYVVDVVTGTTVDEDEGGDDEDVFGVDSLAGSSSSGSMLTSQSL